MIERDRTNCVESTQIISVGSVVAVPRDHVERRMVRLARPQIPAKFRNDLHRSFAVYVPGDRRLEVAWIGQSVRPDRPQIGQPKLRAIILTNVPAGITVGNSTRNFSPRGRHAISPGPISTTPS